MDASFSDLVREQFALLLSEHDFMVVEAAADEVVLESPRLRTRDVLSPRGELDVCVFPKGSQEWEGWTYSGMVGRASVKRLLALALEKLLEDPRIVAGDPAFFERVASERSAESEALTAHAEGKGPRPSKRRLPYL